MFRAALAFRTALAFAALIPLIWAGAASPYDIKAASQLAAEQKKPAEASPGEVVTLDGTTIRILAKNAETDQPTDIPEGVLDQL